MKIEKFKKINVKGLLATFVIRVDQFEIHCKLCKSKDGKNYISFPSEKYVVDGNTKYKNLVWYKGALDILLADVEALYTDKKEDTEFFPTEF